MQISKLIILLLLPSLSFAMSYRQVIGIDGNISMAVIQRLEDNAFIPVNPDNRDYTEFLKWQKEGGVIEPPLEQPKSEPVLTTEDKLNNLLELLKTKGILTNEETNSVDVIPTPVLSK